MFRKNNISYLLIRTRKLFIRNNKNKVGSVETYCSFVSMRRRRKLQTHRAFTRIINVKKNVIVNALFINM